MVTYPFVFLVSAFGIKELLPAYFDPDLKPSDLLTGVSFASGGAGYDPSTSNLQVYVFTLFSINHLYYNKTL